VAFLCFLSSSFFFIQKLNIKSMLNGTFIHNSRFDGTTDAVGIQFFLKNVHPRMKAAASALFGLPDSLDARPNTFGELMRAIISPSGTVKAAVNWALKGVNPDVVLHMRMMANRYGALLCMLA
jgi:hypothetical protein